MSETDAAPLLRLARAFDFAARLHAGQRRKGPRAEPYVNHLSDVARRLAEATGGRDPDLVIAGVLHDAVEDTDATPDDIAVAFGADVAAVVAEVTDDKSLPKDVRKRLQVERTPHKSVRARRLKLADLASNLTSLADDPPARWPLERRRAYVTWAEAVAAGCRGVDAALEAGVDAALAAARRAVTG